MSSVSFYCDYCSCRIKVVRNNIKIEGPIAIIECPKCNKTYTKNLSSLSVATCERDHFHCGVGSECGPFNTMGLLDKARSAIFLAQYISKKVNDDYPGATKKKTKKK